VTEILVTKDRCSATVLAVNIIYVMLKSSNIDMFNSFFLQNLACLLFLLISADQLKRNANSGKWDLHKLQSGSEGLVEHSIKGKAEHLYSTLHSIQTTLERSGTDHTV